MRSSVAAAAGALALGPLGSELLAAPTQRDRSEGLRLLILGGTGFIGPYVVRHAIQRGHTVTLFNRGRTNTHLFPEVEKLIGDRDGQLDALKNRDWDAVLDNTGYVPRHVRDSAQLLKGSVGRYLFTSTRQVFADFRAPNKKEDAPKVTLDDPTSENVSEHYGALKVRCERAVNEVYGTLATIVRPTAVAGPGDRSDRFTYWPVRINRGGEVLAPGTQTDPIQYIDVRDLAEFMIRLIENETPGTFNAAGPEADLSVAEFLYGCRAITSANVRFTWVPADFLAEQNVQPRRSMPLWISPKKKGETRSPVNRDKAVAHGLKFRPLAVTARDTLDWYLSKPQNQQRLRRGISAEREAEVLAAWRARPRSR
ncbi:MAG: SDR family oxidoreductase [Phycisphaerales bacterium]